MLKPLFPAFVVTFLLAANCLPDSLARASIATFTDRTAWQTAAGGAPGINVNFEGFVMADTPVGAGFDIGPFSITGTLPEDAYLDVPPLTANVNGTTDLLVALSPVESVTFTFDAPVFSFGADVRPVVLDIGGFIASDVGETFNVTANNGMSTTLTLPVTDVTGFRGFISDTAFTAVTFSTTAALSVDGTTFFGLDNVAAHAAAADGAVPEATTLAVWSVLTGLGICVAKRQARFTHQS